ncbi:B-box-type zinc finger domain-containing protein [Dioscorea alata]|uniref:B-box-type zinc finger domain-containing protein n=1 Tax=Dioscorea alata TaxID=55571 RepID=A0ACB7TY52_DIOAL|nr:B-box-type zinc finger domain-containing protein [Dioscorea alata]
MKECELCEKAARMYCESDQASLCWECDARVHGANFLVARHTRSLLCRGCQEPTPWRASGARLGQTVSVCDRCTGIKRNGSDAERDAAVEDGGEGDNEEDEDEDDDEEEEDEDDDDGEEEEEEEEDGENQVVPGTMTPPPPPVASSSSSDECSTRIRNGILKRMRESTDLAPQDDLHSSSSHHQPRSSPDDEATSLRPTKDRKTAATIAEGSPATTRHLLDLRSLRGSPSRPI